jgi:addiction module HigA family antidote
MLREEFMKPRGLSINGLALELRLPAAMVGEIVSERRGITADTALRLARYFGTSADFWMSVQKNFELVVAREEVDVMCRASCARLRRVALGARAAPPPNEDQAVAMISKTRGVAQIVAGVLAKA